MADLRVEDIRISEQFLAMAKACDAPLPWEECDGGVCDADGNIVLEVTMPDPEQSLKRSWPPSRVVMPWSCLPTSSTQRRCI